MSSSEERPFSTDRVPTLTEVVELPVRLPPLRAAAPFGSDGATDVPQLGGLLLDDGSTWVSADQSPANWTALEPHGDAADMRSIRAFDDHNNVGAEANALLDAPLDHRPGSALGVEEAPKAGPAAQPVIEPDALVVQVLQELVPRIDLLFEAALRDAVAPALARAVDGLVHDAREDMAAAVRAVVEQAVARALEARAAR